jgi:putative ATP-binding cassette transporter
MSFYNLIRREMQGSLPRMVVMSGLAGGSNAAILAAVNAGAQAAADGKSSVMAAVLFVISLALYVKTQQYILIATTVEIEAIIHKVRLRLMDHVRRSELVPLDGIGRAEITSAITKETQTLQQAASMFAFTSQGLVLVLFVSIYIAYLSIVALVMSIVVVGLAAGLFLASSARLAKEQREALEWENRLFDRLTDLLDGFKEVRLNSARSEELFNDIVEVSRTAANIKIRSQSETFKRIVFSQSSVYVLLGAVVFIVPMFSSSSGTAIQKTTMALLFVIGACWGIVQSVPLILAADAAADNIERLENKLKATAVVPDTGPTEPAKRFDNIEMRDITFHYLDKFSEAAFKIGPLDFTLRSGELVFIMGGNGSGKSTFMKVLAGLYMPHSGQITLDGVPIRDNNRETYRSLITGIFADYHLFRKLYGIPDVDAAQIEQLLDEYRLLDKTHLTNREFDTIELSGGQRKRLALIVSLLEKRPIMLLDEWAAEQDPEFRRKFYHELLPELNRAGATIVVISHDDRYIEDLDFPCRIVRMDEGRFVELRSRSLENA